MATNGIKMQLVNNIEKVNEELEKNLEEAMKQATKDVHLNLTKNVLRGNRGGIQYAIPGTRRGELKGTSAGEGRKPKKTKWYRASAPFEAPAVRLGDLRTSYRWSVEGKGARSTGVVGTPLAYGLHLEYGTRHMAPRPHLAPAFDMSREQIMKRFEGLL